MKFGTKVRVQRGGGAPTGTPGCTRWVRGVLVGARGHERIVRLTENDPLDTVGWNKAGQVGRWSASVVQPECIWCNGTGFVQVTQIMCRTCHGEGYRAVD
jgi:hypothetical protein